MLTFSKILTEENLYYERNGKAYGRDSAGKEFEITPELVGKYYDKFGGRYRVPAAALGGGALSGLGIGVANTLANHYDPDLTTPAIMGTAALGGIGTGLLVRNQAENIVNDIVRKRMEKKI